MSESVFWIIHGVGAIFAVIGASCTFIVAYHWRHFRYGMKNAPRVVPDDK